MDVIFDGPDIMFGRPNWRWKPEQSYISPEKKEMCQYLQDFKKETAAEEPLCPYLLERMASFNEMEKCLLCCSEIPKQYYYECLTCHDDILIFLKIMHDPKFCIPLRWGEFASHPLRVTPKRTGDQFDTARQCFFIDYNAVGDEDSTHYFLANSNIVKTIDTFQACKYYALDTFVYSLKLHVPHKEIHWNL